MSLRGAGYGWGPGDVATFLALVGYYRQDGPSFTTDFIRETLAGLQPAGWVAHGPTGMARLAPLASRAIRQHLLVTFPEEGRAMAATLLRYARPAPPARRVGRPKVTSAGCVCYQVSVIPV